jgi:polyribonucleotide nucleotidyltransferase
MYSKKFEIEFGGRPLIAEFTDLAHKADGSVLIRYGETVLLITAVMAQSANLALPYLPLSVEFEERFYASGAILGSRFIRREGRPTEQAILSARIVDRTIRPLFNHYLRNDIQVVITLLAQGDEDADVLAVIGASLALGVSDIPWSGPVSAVRIAQESTSDDIIINPGHGLVGAETLAFEILACGCDNRITMVETAAREMSESDALAVLEAATVLHTEINQWQQTIISEIGKAKRAVTVPVIPPAVSELFTTQFSTPLREMIFSKKTGRAHFTHLKEQFIAAVSAAAIADVPPHGAALFFEEALNTALHRAAIHEQTRPDGRDFDTVRPLYAQAGGVSPVLHGSGIFYRGDTHIFTALTLGGPEAAQTIDTADEAGESKRFMHHYNFPPFSVGETGRVGGFNRRMVGHGALAEKALLPVIPPATTFPYTIRLVSETLASNGSSSMGSVCASTLALMDGGVPITKPVAGIASGIMIDGNSYVLLTDIQGPEDEHGDMDFKVAGTRDGVTAIQMDVKIHGVTLEMLAGALEKARIARLHILDTINNCINTPRTTISPRAPEIQSLQILPSQIGLVIGGGGKTINKIKEESGVQEITIDDSGLVYATGKNGSAARAIATIAAMTRIYTIGEQVDATITRIAAFGAFAKIDSHNEGLIHISEIAPFRLDTVEGILKEGDVVPVVVCKIEDGKIGLSIKQRDADFASKRGVTAPTPKQ